MILTSTDVGTKAVVKDGINICRGLLAPWEGDAAQNGVDGNVTLWQIGPGGIAVAIRAIAQIADPNLFAGDVPSVPLRIGGDQQEGFAQAIIIGQGAFQHSATDRHGNCSLH